MVGPRPARPLARPFGPPARSTRPLARPDCPRPEHDAKLLREREREREREKVRASWPPMKSGGNEFALLASGGGEPVRVLSMTVNCSVAREREREIALRRSWPPGSQHRRGRWRYTNIHPHTRF